MKKALLLLTLLLLLCVLGTVLVVKQINTRTLRLYLQTTCEQVSGKPLVLEEDVEISLLPLGVRFGRASWGMVGGQPAPTGLSVAVKGGLLRLEMLPLFSGKIRVTEVRLDAPQIVLAPDAPAATPQAPPASAAAPQAAEWRIPPFTLDALRISDAALALHNAGATPLKAHKVNITLTGLAPGAAAATHIDGEIDTPAFAGSLDLDALTRLDATSLRLEDARLALRQIRGPLPPRQDARLAATVEVQLAAPQAVRVDALDGAVGDCSLAGNVTVALGDTPRVQGHIELGSIDINRLLAASQANTLPPGRTKAPATSAANTPGKAATALPALDLRLHVGKLLYDGLSLVNLEAHITSPGGAQALVRPLRASLGTGGTLEGHGTLDLTRQHWRTTGRAGNVAAGPVVQAITGSRSLDGTASLDWNVHGEGLSARAVRRTLGGSGHFTLSAARVYALPQSLRLLTGKDDVRLERVSVPFTAQGGVITLRDMRLNGSAGGVGLKAAGQGTVRLPDERVHMALDIHAGGVRIPALVSGTFGNLTCSVDPAKAASTLLNAPNALPNALPGPSKDGGNNTGDTLHKAGKDALRMLLGR